MFQFAKFWPTNLFRSVFIVLLQQNSLNKASATLNFFCKIRADCVIMDDFNSFFDFSKPPVERVTVEGSTSNGRLKSENVRESCNFRKREYFENKAEPEHDEENFAEVSYKLIVGF